MAESDEEPTLPMPDPERSARHDPFPSTAWTAIFTAGAGARGGDYEASWRRLLEAYRLPIESSLRRLLGSRLPELSADEATAEFFTYVFEHDVLGQVNSARGSFRQFIQGVARNFVRERMRAGRRWRGAKSDGDASPGAPRSDRELEVEEERAWMWGLLRDALRRYQRGHPRQARVFATSYGLCLEGESSAPTAIPSAAELAEKLDTTIGAIHAARTAARKYIRGAVRQRIGEAAGSWDEYDAEVGMIERRAEEQSPGIFGEALAG